MGRKTEQKDYRFFYGLKQITIEDLPNMIPWHKCRVFDKRTERKIGTMRIDELLRKFG